MFNFAKMKHSAEKRNVLPSAQEAYDSADSYIWEKYVEEIRSNHTGHGYLLCDSQIPIRKEHLVRILKNGYNVNIRVCWDNFQEYTSHYVTYDYNIIKSQGHLTFQNLLSREEYSYMLDEDLLPFLKEQGYENETVNSQEDQATANLNLPKP